MPIIIDNPQQDQRGNSKENIFIATLDGQYLGHAYAWAYENHHTAYERPWNVYFEVNPEPQYDTALREAVRDELYDRVYARALELRAARPELPARVYTSAQTEEALAFFVRKGLRGDDAITLMEGPLPAAEPAPLPCGHTLVACDLDDPAQLDAYRQAHGIVFVTPLNDEEFDQHRRMPHFSMFCLVCQGETLAWSQVFQRDDSGHVETLFVTDGARNRGLGRMMLSHMLRLFRDWGCQSTTLEVWLRNRRAVKLYESFGYQKIKTQLYFPGIDL